MKSAPTMMMVGSGSIAAQSPRKQVWRRSETLPWFLFSSAATVLITTTSLAYSYDFQLSTILIGALGLLLLTIIFGWSRRVLSIQHESARVSSENALTLQAFYDHAPALMGVVELLDHDDILHVYDNAATCAFFWVKLDSTRGMRASELGIPCEALRIWRQHYEESERTQGLVSFEYSFERNGERRRISATVCPIRAWSDTRRFCYVAEDVTAYKQASAQLVQTRQRLEDALEASTIAT